MKRIGRFLRPLGALAGVTGAAAALNRGLRESGGIPVNQLGGSRRAWQWHGYETFVTEAGSGPPVLLVHGVYAGASSFEFRKVFPLLARSRRVFAFDLIGCGLSDMPAIEYTTETFVEQIVDAIGAFADGPVTLVGSSLGAAFAIRAAARLPDRIASLVAICPTGLEGVLDHPQGTAQAALAALLRSPVAGETLFNGIASKAAIRRYLRSQIYADAALVSPDVVEHHYAVTHLPGARYVPAAFIGGALNCNVARDLPFVEAPVLVLWGDRASKSNPWSNAPEYVRLAKRARLVTVPGAGLLPHDEAPEIVADAMLASLAAGVDSAPSPY